MKRFFNGFWEVWTRWMGLDWGDGAGPDRITYRRLGVCNREIVPFVRACVRAKLRVPARRCCFRRWAIFRKESSGARRGACPCSRGPGASLLLAWVFVRMFN